MQLHPKLAALLGNSKVYIPVGKDSHVECLQSTLEYLITVQHVLKVHNEKLPYTWLVKKDNLMI